MIALAERQQDWPKTERLLEESQKLLGDTVELRLAEAQFVVRREDPKAIDRLQKLGENVDRFSLAERTRLWNGLAVAAAQTNDLQRAKQLCQRIAAEDLYNVQIRYQLLDHALRARAMPI